MLFRIEELHPFLVKFIFADSRKVNEKKSKQRYLLNEGTIWRVLNRPNSNGLIYFVVKISTNKFIILMYIFDIEYIIELFTRGLNFFKASCMRVF